MVEEVIVLLHQFGLTAVERDPLLDFVIQNVTQTIKNETNQSAIPEGLKNTAIYMAAGQYLNLKKGSGQLEGFDLDAVEKQIQEGDTSITFAIGDGSKTPEQRLDGLIAFLMNSGTNQFSAYRRLRW